MLDKYLKQSNSVELNNWINTTLKAYLRKNQENQGEIEHILDFLNSDRAPKRLQKMSYAQAKISAEKWVKALTKKGNHLDDSNEIEVIKRYKNGFKFVRLVGKTAFEREGFLASHCVVSYFGKKNSEVYSLRDGDNHPHCTIEILRKEGLVNQIKGKGNGSIHPKYIKMVLAILKYFNKEIRPTEMINLGYTVLEKYEVSMVKAANPKAIIMTYKYVPYLFVGI